MREEGYQVVESGLELDGRDFFHEDLECDMFISNPPYSIKDKILKRTLDRGHQFMYLLPIDVLMGISRHKIFKDHTISFIAFDGRIDFTGKRSNPTGTGWLTNIFDESRLILETLGKNNYESEKLEAWI